VGSGIMQDELRAAARHIQNSLGRGPCCGCGASARCVDDRAITTVSSGSEWPGVPLLSRVASSSGSAHSNQRRRPAAVMILNNSYYI